MTRNTLFALLFAALLAFAAAQTTGGSTTGGSGGATEGADTGECSVEISDNGEIKFTGISGIEMKLNLLNLTEFTAAGAPVSGAYVDFNNVAFTFQSKVNETFKGLPTIHIFYSAVLTVNGQSVTIGVDFYAFLSTGTFTYGTSTFTVSPAAFKWTLTITGWPFADPANKLALVTKIEAPEGGAEYDGAAKSANFGAGADVEYPGDCQYDNEVSSGNYSQVDGVDGSVDGDSVTYTVWFSSFNTTVSYDPVVKTTGATNGASATLESFFLFAFKSVLSLF